MSYLSINNDVELFNYIKKVESFPMLEASEEILLSRAWYHHQSVEAAQKLVTSYLRLVVKIAFRFKNYGFSIMELIAEGNIGLLKAVKNFNPDFGHKVCTYATWWIKASIQEYILRSWSLVKIGTTTVQRKLFFSLRKLKNKFLSSHQGNNSNCDALNSISKQLSIPYKDVEEMDNLLSNRELSLNNPINNDSTTELCDTLESADSMHDNVYLEQQDLDFKKALLKSALDSLDQRYRDIIIRRKLSDPPQTLESLSEKYNISMERIRQIEKRAFEKIRTYMLSHTALN